MENWKTGKLENWKTGKYLENLSQGIIEFRWLKNEKILESLNQSSGQYHFGKLSYSNGKNTEARDGHVNFEAAPIIDFYLLQLLSLAKQHHIDIYWYTMPFNESSRHFIAPNYEKSFANYLEKLAKTYKIKVINGINYLPYECFGDPSHIYNCTEDVSTELFYSIYSQ